MVRIGNESQIETKAQNCAMQPRHKRYSTSIHAHFRTRRCCSGRKKRGSRAPHFLPLKTDRRLHGTFIGALTATPQPRLTPQRPLGDPKGRYVIF